jgi:hypothetical protein
MFIAQEQINLGEDEKIVGEYHVIKVIKISSSIFRFIKSKTEVLANGYVVLTNRRLVYLHNAEWSDKSNNVINYREVKDVYLPDIIRITGGYETKGEKDGFIFSVETKGRSLEVGVPLETEKQEKGSGTPNLLFFLIKAIFSKKEKIYKAPTAQAKQFCRDIGARILELQN